MRSLFAVGPIGGSSNWLVGDDCLVQTAAGVYLI